MKTPTLPILLFSLLGELTARPKLTSSTPPPASFRQVAPACPGPQQLPLTPASDEVPEQEEADQSANPVPGQSAGRWR